MFQSFLNRNKFKTFLLFSYQFVPYALRLHISIRMLKIALLYFLWIPTLLKKGHYFSFFSQADLGASTRITRQGQQTQDCKLAPVIVTSVVAP
jgi:hypothetical protein